MNECCCIEYLWVAFTGGIQLFFRRSGESRVWKGTGGVRLCLMLWWRTYISITLIDVLMVVVGVGSDFCCIRVTAVFCLSYCWLLTVQSDVSHFLGDTSGQLCQCVLHCMSKGLVQTCCQSWGAVWPCSIWIWMPFC